VESGGAEEEEAKRERGRRREKWAKRIICRSIKGSSVRTPL
jgi:hypothetical protein